MKIIEKTADLKKIIAKLKQHKQSIGFVPTMGALHRGHLELVKRSVKENMISIVSIFVNPTQFNDPNDFLNYPRTLEKDCQLLEQTTENKIIFAPSAKEMYSEKDKRTFYFGDLETIMEGKFRSGHFKGVAQVVSRLCELVKPDRAYFGEKDFQQLVIVRTLAQQLHWATEIVPHPTIREENGLALSSRNTHLNPEQRKKASIIFQTLQKSQQEKSHFSITSLKKKVTDTINSISGFRVEYFELVNENTLRPVSNWEDAKHTIGCLAVYVGGIRLIDNIRYR